MVDCDRSVGPMIALAEVAQALGCSPLQREAQAIRVTYFAYRLAEVRAGALYVAAPGVGDGPDRAGAAAQRGAVAILTETPLVGLPGTLPQLQVEDVEVALYRWARHVLSVWKPRALYILGERPQPILASLVAAVLSERFRVTRGSPRPSSLGRLALPTALAEMDRAAEVAVFDLGTRDADAVADQVALYAPEAVVLGAPVGLGTERRLAELEPSLLAALVVIANADGERLALVRERSQALVEYGRQSDGLKFAVESCGCEGSVLRFTVGEESAAGSVALHSERFAGDAAAAVALGLHCGLDLEDAVAALGRYEPVDGYMRPLAGRSGVKLVDDTEVGRVADAAADVEAALRGAPAGGRYVVLAGAEAWGPEGLSLFAEAVRAHADGFWGLGEGGSAVARALREAGHDAHDSYSAEHLERSLAKILRPGDRVLFCGGADLGLDGVLQRLGEGPGATASPPSDDGHPVERRPDRPTWIEVDVEALAHNTRIIRETCGVPLMAVLKADAYGHGAERMARVVLENGADAIAVACLSEARTLRRAGVTEEILILGYTPPWQAREAVAEGVSCALYDWDMAKALFRAARDLGTTAVVHVKVDTGLSRLGLSPEEVPGFLERLRDLPGLEVRGVFTHFGSADVGDLSHAHMQLSRFRDLLMGLEQAGLRPPVAHAANTAASMRLPEARLDMVRTAIGLYGLSPSPEASLPAGFRPALSFKTTVAQVKWVGPGNRVGYGRAFETAEPTKVAVLPVGYGDGFRRSPRNWGQVLIGGKRCPILGNICMDQTMADVTGVPDVAAGDEAVLIGRQGDATISVDEVAANLGTIVYEVVAAILARVPRIIR